MRRLTAALVVALLALAPQPVSADTLEPSVWPPEVALGSAPNAIRFGGTDRYQTGLASALALRGTGGFPFDSPDRTTGTWWGAATCPGSVIVVAGDTPADALAAAPLSDATNRGDEPRLQRVASADPLFDPVGGTDRVDTHAAPIIVTTSARSGARGLAAPARHAVTDLRAGGCTAAREAIIVGGHAAVPVEVEGELLDLGYEEVFRVAGADRFDTAARIAAALGTEPAPAGGDCVDERADDGTSAMGFYGNAVIEYRPDATSCQLQGRTVLLADGSVGADALAAGWWTSFWQVPVLLVAGDGSLPAPTRHALETMAIDTIVVLGGTDRIPEPVVEEAKRLATAVAGRFAGADRYETSLVTAKVFGGWHPTGDGADFSGDRLCLAASSAGVAGSPDALAAGPWCARLAHLADTRRAPSRVLEPVANDSTALVPPRPAHDAVPVLLVPGGRLPTQPVADLLEAAFTPATEWCTGATTLGCSSPGFAVAFGGSAAVSGAALRSVSVALSGGDLGQAGADPTLAEPFRTSLDLTPVYRSFPGDGSGAWGCAERGTLRGARWLAVYAEAALLSFRGALDVTGDEFLDRRSNVPLCIGVAAGQPAALVGVSAAGRQTATHLLQGEPAHTISLSAAISDTPTSTTGVSGTSDSPGTTTIWRLEGAPPSRVQLRDGDRVADVVDATAELVLTRADGARPHRVTGELGVDDEGGGAVIGTLAGEAVRDGNRWHLAGRFQSAAAAGGFRATVDTRGTVEDADDLVTWRFDAARP